MSEKITVEFKNSALYTTITYPQKDLELNVKGTPYIVGINEPQTVTQVVYQNNIPILLEFLQEQFGLINGRYEESKKQLESMPDIEPKLAEMLEEHSKMLLGLQSKDVKKAMTRFPAYAELCEKVLKRKQLQQTIKDLEPSVKKIRDQINLVLKETEHLK